MKKKNVNTLRLNKKSISNFHQNQIVGAAPNTRTYCNCQAEPEPVKASRFIESNCIGCTITTVSG